MRRHRTFSRFDVQAFSPTCFVLGNLDFWILIFTSGLEKVFVTLGSSQRDRQRILLPLDPGGSARFNLCVFHRVSFLMNLSSFLVPTRPITRSSPLLADALPVCTRPHAGLVFADGLLVNSPSLYPPLTGCWVTHFLFYPHPHLIPSLGSPVLPLRPFLALVPYTSCPTLCPSPPLPFGHVFSVRRGPPFHAVACSPF